MHADGVLGTHSWGAEAAELAPLSAERPEPDLPPLGVRFKAGATTEGALVVDAEAAGEAVSVVAGEGFFQAEVGWEWDGVTTFA
jgi:hypothetical protein